MMYFLIALIILGVIVVGGSFIYIKTVGKYFRWLYHDILRWHIVTEDDLMRKSWWDGCNVHCYCSICKKEVIQDSQGNWF